MTFIDYWAFTSCHNLESIYVDINNPVFTSVNGVLFNKDCSNLIIFPNKHSRNYTIPESVFKIRSDAFFRCNSIVSIQINSKISSLNFELFEGCDALTKIDVNPNNQFFTSIYGALFSNDLTRLIFLPGYMSNKLSIPNQTISIACSNSKCSLLSFRLSVDNNTNFAILKNSFLIDLIKMRLIAISNPYQTMYDLSDFGLPFSPGLFQYNSRIQSVILPKSITNIPAWCFDSCINLQSISFSNQILYIEENAFRDCHRISTLHLPNNLIQIGDKAFLKCIDLERVKLPKSVCKIGAYSFFGCKNLKYVVLSDKITSIPQYSFAFCRNLKTILVPDSVSFIHESAFYQSNQISFVCAKNSYAFVFAIQHRIKTIQL